MSEQQFYETVTREQEFNETFIEGKTMTYEQISKINVNKHTETKNGLTYLTWAWAWDIFKRAYPEATYKVIKTAEGLPYFESQAGVMCYTEVTAGGLTHEMWLPVMDGANNAMKREAYKYQGKFGEKTCAAFDMFDVNKTIMRCLVKNLAMFGLAIYIYAGEDLPIVEADSDQVNRQPTSCITMTQVTEIQDVAARVGVDASAICAAYKINALNEIPTSMYAAVVRKLNAKGVSK